MSLLEISVRFQENQYQVNKVTCLKGRGSRFLRDFGILDYQNTLCHNPENQNPNFTSVETFNLNLLISLKKIMHQSQS